MFYHIYVIVNPVPCHFLISLRPSNFKDGNSGRKMKVMFFKFNEYLYLQFSITIEWNKISINMKLTWFKNPVKYRRTRMRPHNFLIQIFPDFSWHTILSYLVDLIKGLRLNPFRQSISRHDVVLTIRRHLFSRVTTTAFTLIYEVQKGE